MEKFIELYFGEVSEVDANDGHEYFQPENGKSYYYKLVATDAETCIWDTIGRAMPIDLGSMRDLGLAVFAANQFYAAIEDSENLFVTRMRELGAVVEHLQ